MAATDVGKKMAAAGSARGLKAWATAGAGSLVELKARKHQETSHPCQVDFRLHSHRIAASHCVEGGKSTVRMTHLVEGIYLKGRWKDSHHRSRRQWAGLVMNVELWRRRGAAGCVSGGSAGP